MPSSSPATYREVRLTRRPEGELTPDHLQVVTFPIPDPTPGQVLVRNTLMSVTAVMRTLMRDETDLPVTGYAPDRPLWGPALGEVVAVDGSDAGLVPGDLVTHRHGWREYAVGDAAEFQRVDPAELPDPAAHLSQGFTAWLGIVRGAQVRAGDTVFVSAAAGGVGTLAGQFARLRGAARVIGSTSSERKARVLVEQLGYDAAVIRGAGSMEDQLRAAAPEGLDAVFDNVGGEQLSAALAVARRGARIALIGALDGQLSGGFRSVIEVDSGSLILRGITVRGLSGSDHLDALPEWTKEFGQGLRDGTLTFPHVRVSGIDQAPRALCDLLEGRHIGAVLVEL
ncbi:MDR family NADP-dependent oxidoreductase [Streptomyces griseus]|uniref:MDR family NADP-dependent oxidoreductase n=1 Tax=Streptomyces griseus TaxID=1911 RepID=UPI00214A8B4C|nr:NADP-dependent oxidoreductase [Streptomyces griseus]